MIKTIAIALLIISLAGVVIIGGFAVYLAIGAANAISDNYRRQQEESVGL